MAKRVEISHEREREKSLIVNKREKEAKWSEMVDSMPTGESKWRIEQTKKIQYKISIIRGEVFKCNENFTPNILKIKMNNAIASMEQKITTTTTAIFLADFE